MALAVEPKAEPSYTLPSSRIKRAGRIETKIISSKRDLDHDQRLPKLPIGSIIVAMRPSALLLVLLSVCSFTPAILADSITSINPSTMYIYTTEVSIEIDGTGLVGNVATHVVYSGPGGTVSLD